MQPESFEINTRVGNAQYKNLINTINNEEHVKLQLVSLILFLLVLRTQILSERILCHITVVF